jgi:hypothetical protein
MRVDHFLQIMHILVRNNLRKIEIKSPVALAPTISMEREKAMRKQPSAPIPAIILNKWGLQYSVV